MNRPKASSPRSSRISDGPSLTSVIAGTWRSCSSSSTSTSPVIWRTASWSWSAARSFSMVTGQRWRGMMFVSASPFDGVPTLRQRAVGRVSFAAASFHGRTRPMRIEESGSMRIRLPKGEGAGLDAVLVNTAGGIACGDQFTVEIEAQADARVTVATPAAEKVYRSDGPVSTMVVKLTAGAGVRLDWLPQETILFDSARL